jgi:hypothetical protein
MIFWGRFFHRSASENEFFKRALRITLAKLIGRLFNLATALSRDFFVVRFCSGYAATFTWRTSAMARAIWFGRWASRRVFFRGQTMLSRRNGVRRGNKTAIELFRRFFAGIKDFVIGMRSIGLWTFKFSITENSYEPPEPPMCRVIRRLRSVPDIVLRTISEHLTKPVNFPVAQSIG